MKWVLSVILDADSLEQALDRTEELPSTFQVLPPWLHSYDLQSLEPLQGRLVPTRVRVVKGEPS